MFDLDGRWSWKGVWKGIQKVAKKVTDSKLGRAIQGACGFVPGLVGAACGTVFAISYAVQGRGPEAIWAAAGVVGGGLVTSAYKFGFKKAYLSAYKASTRRHPVAQTPGRAWRSATWGSSELHGIATGQLIDHYKNRRRR